MVSFQGIIKDIQSLKIQGAENVARAGVEAISIIITKYSKSPRSAFIKQLDNAKTTIFKTRPTEPALRNSLNYITYRLESEADIYGAIQTRSNEVKQHFAKIEETIAKIGARKITNNSIIFTHCHSSTVISVMEEAKQQGIKFTVHNTETRPLFQGRITAKELARLKIPIIHHVDSAARIALKKADLMLLGADAITSEGKVINKIGSELFAEAASRYGVPLYICTDSWKFDPASIFGVEEEIEKRHIHEIWPKAPKGINIDNTAFERIDPHLITGIISELGVYRPEIFVTEVRRAYPWMF